jgi:hypothetical protein
MSADCVRLSPPHSNNTIWTPDIQENILTVFGFEKVLNLEFVHFRL